MDPEVKRDIRSIKRHLEFITFGGSGLLIGSLLAWLFIMLSGCAAATPTDLEHQQDIRDQYEWVKADCDWRDGVLNVPRHRVQNALPNIWEFPDAWCATNHRSNP